MTARDQGCVFPGCDQPPDRCDADHIVAWWAHGPTAIDNLALVCGRHHTLRNRGDYHIHADLNGGRPTFTRPDGTPIGDPVATAAAGPDPP